MFRYYKYKEIRKRIPHPTKQEWISMNTDGIECPLSRVYSKREALNMFKEFNVQGTRTKEFGWFRIIWGTK